MKLITNCNYIKLTKIFHEFLKIFKINCFDEIKKGLHYPNSKLNGWYLKKITPIKMFNDFNCLNVTIHS